MANGYAQNTNLNVIRGDTLDWGMLTSNNASSTITALKNGTVINLTAATIKLTCKYSYDDADIAAVFQLTIGSGITVTSAGSGQFTAVVPAASTSSLAPIIYNLPYDLQVTESGGAVTTIMSGLLTINPDATITTP